MKQTRVRAILAGGLAAAVLCVGAGVAVAANGDANDPLITLSYLDQTVIPAMITQVESKTAANQAELEQSFKQQIASYKQEMESMLGLGSSGSAAYVVVDLTAGQRLVMEVGCEVMLRVGSATVNAATNPALIDISDGTSLNGGAALRQNHLYMATIADRSVQATSANVKVLVRGGYSIV